jgi:hypothetical protein
MSVDLRNDPNWRTKAPFGMHVDGSPLTQAEYEALRGKQSRTETIHVKVDNDAITETMNENKRLKQEIENSQEAKALYDDMKEKAALQLTNLGIPTEAESIHSKDDLDRSIATIRIIQSKQGSRNERIPSGTVPLSSQQSSSNPQVFNSQEELIDNLRDRVSASNPNKQDRDLAKSQLDTMMVKAFRGQKDCNKPFDFTMPKDVSINDVMNAKYQRRRKLAKGE